MAIVVENPAANSGDIRDMGSIPGLGRSLEEGMTAHSRQEYWNGLPFPSPGDLPDPGMERRSSALQAEALPSEPPGSLNIRKFSVHILLKPSLENFEHYFASM